MVRLPFGPRRADKEGEKAKPTEVVLTNSHWTGEPIRINIEPHVLAAGDEARPQRLVSLRRRFCLALPRLRSQVRLDAVGRVAAILPADDAVRIESPQGELAAPIPQPATPRKVPPMSEPTTNTTGKAATNGQAKTDTADSQGFSPQGKPAGHRRP